MEYNVISFPGLGIPEFHLDPAAFTLPFLDREVMWYGIIITVGMVLAFCYALYRTKFERVKSDHIYDLAIFTMIFGVLGARLYYVFTKFDSYIGDSFGETLYNIFAIWEGGLAIYGGIIGGAAAIFAVCLIKKLPVMKIFDLAAPAVMIGQMVGRFGNFTNGEAFGGMVAEGHPLYFVRMGLISDNTYRAFHTTEMVYVHPTFLYESLWNLLGFVLINLFYKKKKFDGQILLSYLAWYGFGRMFIEGLRTDSLYVGPFRISQLVGFACFAVGGALLVILLILQKKGKIPATDSGPALEVEFTQSEDDATDAEQAAAANTDVTENTEETERE